MQHVVGACRLLFISEMNLPDIVNYPDTGTTLAITAPTARLAFPSGSDGPFADLIAAAFDADPGSPSYWNPRVPCLGTGLRSRSWMRSAVRRLRVWSFLRLGLS